MGILLHVSGVQIHIFVGYILYTHIIFHSSSFLSPSKFCVSKGIPSQSTSKQTQNVSKSMEVPCEFWGAMTPQASSLISQDRKWIIRSSNGLPGPSSFHSNLLRCHQAQSPKGVQSFPTSHPFYILPFACQPSA